MDDIHYLAGIIGKDKPEVKRILRYVQMHPQMAYKVRRKMILYLNNKGYDLSDLPIFNLNFPENPPEKGIFLGEVNFQNNRTRPLYLPVEAFRNHCAVFGMTRAGKSTLLKLQIPQFIDSGIYPWIFDHEDEYKALLKVIDPGKLLILNPRNNRDNFLEPPPGVPPGEWIERLCSLVREVFYLRDGSINLLRKILYNLYEDKGILEGSKNYPTIIDLMNTLEAMEFKPGTRHSGYHESLINRFSGLRASLGESLECVRGYPLPELLDKAVVYVTTGLSGDVRNFCVYEAMMKIFAYREKHADDGRKTLFVLDEAHKLYNKEIAKRNDMGEPMIFGNARTFSKRGIMCFYSDQVPSELPSTLTANVGTCMIMRMVSGRCISSISRARNLNPAQRDYIPVMGKRACILQSDEFPEPVLFRVPERVFEPVTQEEVDEHMEGMLENLKYEPVPEKIELKSEKEEARRFPGEKRKRPRARPNKYWKKVAETLAEAGWITLTGLYANMGNVSPWYGRKILNHMEEHGMIELCPISLGTRGNPRTYVVLRPKGADYMGLDYEEVRPRGKGSIEHVVLQNLLAESLRNSGKIVEVEYTANGKAVDIAEHGDTKSVAYEIELEPSHPHVAENAKRDLEAGFDEVVIITRNRITQNEAKNVIYKTLPWEKLSKLDFRLIREFL